MPVSVTDIRSVGAEPRQDQTLASAPRESVRLLIAYVSTGLLIMLVPGTLGFWNLRNPGAEGCPFRNEVSRLAGENAMNLPASFNVVLELVEVTGPLPVF